VEKIPKGKQMIILLSEEPNVEIDGEKRKGLGKSFQMVKTTEMMTRFVVRIKGIRW